MAYILGLIVVGLLFVSMHYFTELSKSEKIMITAVLLGIISSAIAYNAYSDTQRKIIENVVIKFNQNKTVDCDGVDVNSTNYTLSIGTYTFIGKENTPYYGQMVSAYQCK
ncbi:hypothetical protein SAMN06313540_10514 [Epsilonproteobacteria bacterium SCGC AD-308-E02]|nr:hypothetical protein SAMN06313540_10514 [Epsilonproteobacteria bacterium SCGC AD-308-E02]